MYIINSWRVEKSYWQTPTLSETSLRENCILGLEQAGDTIMPKIELRHFFKPFVEDELAGISKNTKKLTAHPVADKICPRILKEQVTLAIGPEGGFIPYEIEKLEEQGFETVTFGERILRVEQAVAVLLGRLF